ncbi:MULTISPECIES: type II toxin-antitoxin system RelE/ParE family toxin [Burkholderia]|uniref:type II toxin-antitoxin system RelE/ParE family toxin n=1 Tax=Burkholderia TaxID=32008 RepID=UPI001CF1EA14|nr:MULTISPECIES: type II toxin-antitoxin system RelE/ParE family toxin [Burkholderia]MCA8238715.1 type II toxin-antitoxin system RelE/ParE family toxin [Burkholderia cenocepacia]MDN7430424.1 type II toxin-antitoxin system RelE/ParE family toxin [Burkholderia sp. AU45388]
MIKSWVHKGLEAFFVTGSKAGIRPDHAPRLRRMLARLDVAGKPHDMNVPGWRFHGLVGGLDGYYAVGVNGNWRLTFRFEGPDVVLVDYQDYH